MAGWGWQSVHDPAVLPDVVARWQASIASGSPFEMTFPLRGADGRFRRFLTRVTPLTDAEGRVLRWFGTNTDVEIERGAREAAERANQAKTDFLATMSHELRTPCAPTPTSSARSSSTCSRTPSSSRPRGAR
jgi:signal transduction histidine kinase